MATKIFTAPTEVAIIDETTNEVISQEKIAIKDGFSSAAIKQAIHIQYGIDGTCTITDENYNKNYIDLGLKNDHRVTWLIIDVDNLIWNWRHMQREHNIELKKDLYGLYNFKLIFKLGEQIHSFNLDTSRLTDKNDLIFEVPRILTTKQGSGYEMLLVIEEYINPTSDYQHNINNSAGEITTQDLDDDGNESNENLNPTNKNVSITYAELPESPNTTVGKPIIERFVSKSITASVGESIYNGEALEVDNLLDDTFQRDSLIKEALWGTLDNDGNLKFKKYNGAGYVTETILGQELDSYVKYIRFAPKDLTQHIINLKPYLFFRHSISSGYEICYSPFEELKDEHGSYYDSDDFEYVVWIPARVYEFPGSWEIGVVAFAGNVPVKPTFNDWTDEQLQYNHELQHNDYYYCYVSNSTTMTVEGNFLTKELFDNLEAWNPGYVMETSIESSTMSLTKEYVDYDAANNKLLLDQSYLSTTDENELIVRTRNSDYTETPISHINGCELVDEWARTAISGLDIDGEIVATMANAVFNGSLNGDEIQFKYQGLEDLVLGRLYSFRLNYTGVLKDSYKIIFINKEGQEPQNLTLATPSTRDITVDLLSTYFIRDNNATTYTWYFNGYIIKRDYDNQWIIVSSADGLHKQVKKNTEAIENLQVWFGVPVVIMEVDDV